MRAGKLTQSDRGRRKKHHNNSVSTATEELRTKTDSHNWESKLVYYQNWLKEKFPTDDQKLLAALPNMSLVRYLQTAPAVSIDIAPSERLRQLAIHWEPVCAQMKQPKGWKILRRIYLEALKYDNTWENHYHSMALSARTCTRNLDRADPAVEVLLKESLEVCARGIFRLPDSAMLYTSRGRTNYELDILEDSIADSEKALELDSKQMWAALYLAHALHDLQRWKEAIKAYNYIDVNFFNGPAAWRGVLVKDQTASCYLYAGNRAHAMELFESALKSYEANPGLLWVPRYLIEAAQGELQAEIGRRVLKLLKREGLEYYW